MKTVIHLFYNPSENGVVEYGFIDSPFGRCLAAFNYSGLCSFEFVDSEERAAAVLRRVWADSWVAATALSTGYRSRGCCMTGRILCRSVSGHDVPVGGMAGPAADSSGRDHDLCRGRGGCRVSRGCPASGVGHRGEQIGRGRTVPPRRVRRRRWRRIPLGPGAEEGDSGLGADGHVGGITALPQQDAAKTADGLSGVAGLFIFVRPEHVAV